MQTASAPRSLRLVRVRWGFYFAHECVAMLFFLALHTLLVLRSGTSSGWLLLAFVLLMSVPLLGDSPESLRLIRQWSAPAWILAAYWSLNLIPLVPTRFSSGWIHQDRLILYDLGLKSLVECLGPVIPFILETVYLLLYALPPLAMGAAWRYGGRRQVERLLLVVFAGTLPVYFLLPCFDVISPQLVYPGADAPSITVLPRMWNLWILEHLDSRTGVFPSGHVAVAFSTAFGLLSTIPARRGLCVTAFVIALLVYVATIYGRYHFAADGLLSIVITAAAWFLTERMVKDS